MSSFSSPHDIARLLAQHRAIALLRKEHAPLMLAFFWAAFRERNRGGSWGAADFGALLSDMLFVANEQEQVYPLKPHQYLENWTREGFLRQFYEEGSEEANFELTPASEKALLWVTDLEQREFVGAESRLMQVVELLRELAIGTHEDRDLRIAQLEEKKREIETEIQAIRNNEDARLDATGIRERYFLLEESAGKLLSDFRQIEENFRRLNSQAREELVMRQGSRGEALDHIFDAQDAILDTDQGRTFDAFWSFLMDARLQEDFNSYIEQVFSLSELDGLQDRSLIPRLKISLVRAGDRVNRTTDRLVEQLRRFLKARAFVENRRVTQVIEEIEELAILVKKEPPRTRHFIDIEGKAAVQLVMDRELFEPPELHSLSDSLPEEGSAEAVSFEALYEQLYVDPAELKGRIQVLLRNRDQISLGEITEIIPVEKGLNEVIAYFSIATQWEQQQKAVIHSEKEESIRYKKEGKVFEIAMPETIFLG